MQRLPLLPPWISSTFNRVRSLRSLLLFSFLPSSMETTSFSSSIDAAADPGKEILLTTSVSEVFHEGEAVKKFGFRRAEFGRDSLVGTVQLYDRHVFLRYKSHEFWPPNVEASKSDRLPRLLAAAVKARKDDMTKRTRLTICGATDNSDTSEGDVLIFPERIGYRRLTDVDVDNFVELVLVKDTEWFPGAVETLTGSYVFVCAHGSRDQRCGVCGPILIEKFKEEISLRALEGQVFVSPCSHIGGHKYAGNVIIFSQSKTGEVSGNWYGYVCPDDVPMLLEQHIEKGEIIDHLWRGQMGLSVEEQRKAQSIRRQPNIPQLGSREHQAVAKAMVTSAVARMPQLWLKPTPITHLMETRATLTAAAAVKAPVKRRILQYPHGSSNQSATPMPPPLPWLRPLLLVLFSTIGTEGDEQIRLSSHICYNELLHMSYPSSPCTAIL